MRSILTFVSMALGLALTLLFGAETGISLGLLVYLVGNNSLLSRELARVKSQLDKTLNDMPDLVHELVQQRLREQEASIISPTAEAETGPVRQDALTLEHSFSASDSKPESLFVQLIPQAIPSLLNPPASALNNAPSPHPSSAPHAHEAAPSASPETEGQKDQVGASHAIELRLSDEDLSAMREFLTRMASLLERSTASENEQKGAIPSQAQAWELPHATPHPPQDNQSSAKRVPIEHLRSDLDKLTYELRTELSRPKR